MTAFAQDPSVPPGHGKGAKMDYGPVLAYTINCKRKADKAAPDNLVLKGLAIKIGQSNEATVCFDTELLRYAAGWTDGFLDISTTHLDTYKGSTEAFMDGQLVFSTKAIPGCIKGNETEDPRPLHAGLLPADWAKFKGFYEFGKAVSLRYTLQNIQVAETPGFIRREGNPVFIRTITVDPATNFLALLLCNEGVPVSLHSNGDWHPEIQHIAGSIVVALPPHKSRNTLSVFINAPDALTTVPTAESIDFRRGGPAQWPEVITTRGRLGFGSPYVVDTLTCPDENPWHSWLRFVAMDFFSDGRAAVSTWNGDIWIVSGIDANLKELKWKRFAAGLFEPLGLRILNDQVYVLERSQITKLHDLNGDGEADYYENFNNDAPIGPSYHAFAFELQTDRAGNFYYARCGHRVDPALPLNGGVIKVAADGSKSELIATGLRAPNGLSVGPHDEVTVADNQGNWVPTSRIDFVRPGGFYGYVPHARQATTPTDYEKPICWIPYQLDNSSGSQIWVTSNRWGPFEGQFLHTSYGKASLFLVLTENFHGHTQGGVVQFPLRFESGIMRGKFSPLDGQLYLCGLKGWQTAGARDAALHRVRYTGGQVRMPQSLHVATNGLLIGFTCPLHESAADPQNFAIEQWNYRWTEKYGSPEYSVKEPNREGHDPVEIKSVRLMADNKSIFLEVPELHPVMQMRIQYRLKAADGSQMASAIYNTINFIP